MKRRLSSSAGAVLLLPMLLGGAVALEARPAAAQQDDLAHVFKVVSTAWARGNASAVAHMSSSDGVSVDISGGPVGPIGERQVAALLRRLFDDVETVGVHEGMLERVGGTPPRAFGSITWMSRTRGTRVPVRTTVYFALALSGDGWRLTDIRLMR